MDELVTVATSAEIPLGHSKCVQVSEKIIAIFHTEEGWFAIDDRCSHRGGPLSEGLVKNKEVTCPWHQARFDLSSGTCVSNVKISSLTTYPVTVESEIVKIRV